MHFAVINKYISNLYIHTLIHVMETLPCITSWWQENKTDTLDSLICISKTFTYIYSQKVLLNKDLCVLAMWGKYHAKYRHPQPMWFDVFQAFFSRWDCMKRNRWLWISMDGTSSSKNIQPGVIWICIVELWISLQVQSTNMTCHHLKKTEIFRYSSDS